jgi:hypothetical protein
MYGWDIALALELLAVLLGFMLWFKAARAEGGPKKLAKVVAIIIIILAVLLAVCTVTRAFMYAGAAKGGAYYKAGLMMHGGHMASAGGGWRCPQCGAEFGKGYGGGMGMKGMPSCPRIEEPAPEEAAAEEPMTE